MKFPPSEKQETRKLSNNTPMTTLSCDQCSFTTFKNIALKKHKKQEHDNRFCTPVKSTTEQSTSKQITPEQSTSVQSEELVFACNSCDKYFVGESDRDDHLCDSFKGQRWIVDMCIV